MHIGLRLSDSQRTVVVDQEAGSPSLAAGVSGRATLSGEGVWVVEGCIPQAGKEAVAALGLRRHLSTSSRAQVHS